MAALEFRLIDVFTDRPFAGNQLAVVLDAASVGASDMQRVAREFNFSETTFVVPSERDGCDVRVRIFTPEEELPMAGHPTIGTALVLQAEGRIGERVTFELGVGPTPVTIANGRAEMRQQPPQYLGLHADRVELAAQLGLRAADISGPPERVSTGAAFLIVPLASLDAIRRLKPASSLRGLVYCFALGGEEPGTTAHCRMFAAEFGMREDAATGSAAGPLAAYLVKHHLAQSPFTFEQGYEMGRPSKIFARVEGQEVQVAGSGVIWARGVYDLSG